MLTRHTLFASLAATCWGMALHAEPITHPDLVYAETSSRNVLDIFVPDDASNPPLVLYVHGGGWLHNSKQDVHLKRIGLDRLMEAGFAVAAMNYRLAPAPQNEDAGPTARAIWPAQLDDIGAALDFLGQNGATYGYDADRIAIFGESAGGQMVLAAGLAFANDPERDLDAVVAWYPATDLAQIDADREAVGLRAANLGAAAPESYLIGADVSVAGDKAAEASPFHMLDTLSEDITLPPFLVMHGQKDQILPDLQSIKFAEKMTALGRDVDLILVPEGTHAAGAFNTDPAVLEAVISHLGEALKGE